MLNQVSKCKRQIIKDRHVLISNNQLQTNLWLK